MITTDVMSSDDSTQDLPDETDRTTQPSITAQFELVREVKQSVDAMNVRLDATNARLDATNARLDEMDTRHARDFAALDARLVELSEEVKSGFIRLEDKIDHITTHSEADYHDLRKPMRKLESKLRDSVA
jgi:phage shock protein A